METSEASNLVNLPSPTLSQDEVQKVGARSGSLTRTNP